MIVLDSPAVFQIIVVKKPVSIPPIAPRRVTFLEYSVNRITGPKLAPRPDQANSTNQKIIRVSISAKSIAPIPIKNIVRRLIEITRFGVGEVCMTLL